MPIRFYKTINYCICCLASLLVYLFFCTSCTELILNHSYHSYIVHGWKRYIKNLKKCFTFVSIFDKLHILTLSWCACDETTWRSNRWLECIQLISSFSIDTKRVRIGHWNRWTSFGHIPCWWPVYGQCPREPYTDCYSTSGTFKGGGRHRSVKPLKPSYATMCACSCTCPHNQAQVITSGPGSIWAGQGTSGTQWCSLMKGHWEESMVANTVRDVKENAAH